MNIRTIISALILFLTAFVPGCKGDIASKEKIRDLIANGALVVDVRTPAEYAQWHYNGSINIPLAEIEQKINLFGSKDRNIIVYCRTGNRSGKAKEILERYGFKNVINGGGLNDMKSLK